MCESLPVTAPQEPEPDSPGCVPTTRPLLADWAALLGVL
jgi:hypothetical protein